MHTIKQLFVVSRPISWLNTAYPFAVGYLLVTHHVDLAFLLGSVFFLIPYNLLMYGVNDVYDYESDMQNPRKGGIEGAKSAKRLHKPILLSSTLLTVLFLIPLFLLADLVASAVLVAVVFFVLAYSVPVLRFKERPFLDSATSSLHFVGPLLYGLVLANAAHLPWLLLVSFFFWAMASHAFGAVQDIEPDRRGHISSIATFLGAQNTVRFAAVLYLASGLLLLPYGIPIALASFIPLLYLANIAPYLAVTDATADRTNKAWRRFIYLNYLSGFCITMLILQQAL